MDYLLFFNPFAVNVKGHCLTIFNYTRIVITKTDLTKFIITSRAKKNNQSNLKPALIHELTHSYRTKTMTLLLILFRSVWKEEGICEVVAVHSSYNVEKGIKRLVSNNPDKGMAWKYFTYRMCVLYLMKHENLTFDEVLKDKRKQKEIMNQLYKMTESGLKALLE